MGGRGMAPACVASLIFAVVQCGPAVADPVVVDTVAVGESPQGVAVTPDGARAYVTNLSNDSVSVIDTVSNSVIGSPIAVGWEPKGIAITPDASKAYVVSFSEALHNESIGSGVTVTAVCPGPTNTGFQRVSGVVSGARAGGAPPMFSTTHCWPVSSLIFAQYRRDKVSVAPPAGKGLMYTVAVIDLATEAITTSVAVGVNPVAVAVTRDGDRAYVTNADDDTVSVIDTATNTVTASVPVGDTPVAVAVLVRSPAMVVS